MRVKENKVIYSMFHRLTSRSFFSPSFPPISPNGWITRYRGFIFEDRGLLVENLLADVIAGITVSMTLIPQALSYSALANLPPIYGLYSALMPCIAYILLGTSTSLAVGPVSLVALLTSSLMEKYNATSEG